MHTAIIIALGMIPAASPGQDTPKPPPLELIYSAKDRQYLAIRFSPDSTKLITGGPSFIRVLDAPQAPRDKFVESTQLRQRGLVDELAFDPIGRVLLSRSRDDDTLLWDAHAWSPLNLVIDNYQGRETPLREGAWLAFPNRGKGVRLWSLGPPGKRRTTVVRYDVTAGWGVSFDHVNAAVVAGDELLMGDEKGRLIRTSISEQIETEIASMPDFRGEKTASERLRPPAPTGAVQAHKGPVTSVSPTPDLKHCVTAGADGQVRLWRLDQILKAQAPMKPRQNDVSPRWSLPGHYAELSANGVLLAAAEPKGVAVYEVKTGKAVSWNPTIQTGGRVVRLRFSADGSYLAGIVCACAECAPGDTAFAMRKRVHEHGGSLYVWR